MKIDSILKAPLGEGLTLERVICANGDVTIDVRNAQGAEVYAEEILRIAGSGAPVDAEASERVV